MSICVEEQPAAKPPRDDVPAAVDAADVGRAICDDDAGLKGWVQVATHSINSISKDSTGHGEKDAAASNYLFATVLWTYRFSRTSVM